MEDFQGKYDGNQIDIRLDKVKDMVGATASGAGSRCGEAYSLSSW